MIASAFISLTTRPVSASITIDSLSRAGSNPTAPCRACAWYRGCCRASAGLPPNNERAAKAAAAAPARIGNERAAASRDGPRAVFLSTITSTPYSPNRLHVDQNVQSSLGRVGKSCIAVHVLSFTDAKVSYCRVRSVPDKRGLQPEEDGKDDLLC